MTSDIRFSKLVKRLDQLVTDLRKHHNIPVHSHINQFYYMQKIEELKLLQQQLSDAAKRMKFVQDLCDEKYNEIFHRWSKDARWLNRYQHVNSGIKSITNSLSTAHDTLK